MFHSSYVHRLTALTRFQNAETTDNLIADGLAEGDLIDAAEFLPARLVFNTDGDEAEVLLAGPGNDTLAGGDADNMLLIQ